MRKIKTKKSTFRTKVIKNVILTLLVDTISLELYRNILQIPFFPYYYLILIAICILQSSFLIFIDYILEKKERPKKEYIINDNLTLKLENNKTNIYVNGELFTQCKFLLLNIPIDKVDELDDIESIDEAAERLNHELEFQHKNKIKISPETEFWAHCSNLQAWAEYKYDVRLLHSNLAFPLLKALTNVGDLIAKEVFKQEIKSRFESFNPSTQEYLIKNGYLNYFNKEERNEIFKLILDENIWLKLGYSYLNEHKKVKALESFLQARNINPINLKTLFAIARISTKTKKFDLALKIYNEILEYYPENLKALIEKDYILQEIKKINC